MKPVYSNLAPKNGVHIAGIKKILIAPREWLSSRIVIDFSTGKVISEVLLNDGKEFLELSFTDDSYDFSEKPKNAKGGSYYEISATGTINDCDETLYQVLETLRYPELVCILYDRQKRKKIVGNIDAAMIMQVSKKETNDQNGLLVIGIDLTMDSECRAPFYNPA